MTAPATERPLSVAPALQTPAESVPIAAVRMAFGEMLDALGIATRPANTVSTDAFLTLLLQASGATVTASQPVAEHTAWLAAVAGYRTPEAAS